MSLELAPFLGEDPRTRAAIQLAERVAPTPATVLIVGETGTGKELVARLVHARSLRSSHPFLAVNCGAVADTLVESELFGHARGAFTGANVRKPGKFESANRGTLFLDEVTSMSAGMQAALLRVLQSGEYCPVGATVSMVCDVRVVAAANRELRPLIDGGAFRADLFYRLNIIRITLPPLRERPGDIPILIDHFLNRYGERIGKRGLRLDSVSKRQLMSHDYPGNVRELESIVQRAVLCSDGSVISVEGLIETGTVPSAAHALETAGNFHRAKAQVVARFERDFVTSALRRSHGVITEAARLSGLSERNFHLKLRKYGLVREATFATSAVSAPDSVISLTDTNVSHRPLA